jgi:hypothetical protein
VLGGVEYRLGKSRYYINKFNQGLKLLGEEEFEDFQPYSKFVNTRLGPAFDYIDLLQARYQRIRRDTRTLYAQSSAEQLRKLVETVRDRNTEIEHIQVIADFALFGFLTPYYVGSILDHLWPFSGGSLPQVYWALLLCLGLACASWRRLRTPKARRIVLWVGLAVALMIITTIAFYEPALLVSGPPSSPRAESAPSHPEQIQPRPTSGSATGNRAR